MLDFYYTNNEKVLCEYLSVPEPDEETKYQLQSYVYACMGHVIDWLTGKLAITPEKLSFYQYKEMPDMLKEAWRISSEKNN